MSSSNSKQKSAQTELKSQRKTHKSSQSGPSRPGKKNRKNRTTIILSISALVLFILIVLLMDRRIIGFIHPSIATATGNSAPPPVIQRTENDAPVANEAVSEELGIPQKPATESAVSVESATEIVASGETTARLFFIRVSDEGRISVKSVLRPLALTDSPLTSSIRALIDGPRPGELSNDILSLIPEGSTLIGARIEKNIAFLDFNEQFRFNALGLEGYRAQIEQVVYTATEFPSVDKVQILIEGQRVDYLGGEGFWVGGPLGRDDF